MANVEQRSKTAHYVGVVYLISLILPVLSCPVLTVSIRKLFSESGT